MKELETERNLLPLECEYDEDSDEWHVPIPDFPCDIKDILRTLHSRAFNLQLAQRKAATYEQDAYLCEWLVLSIDDLQRGITARYRGETAGELARLVVEDNTAFVVHLVAHPDGSTAPVDDPRTKLGRLRAFCGVE